MIKTRQLQEAGKLDIDTPIQSIIPELKIAYHSLCDKPITIRSIMNHTSGLPSDIFSGMLNRHPESFAKAIDYLNSTHAAYEPGTISTYSNVATDLLGVVIERVSGFTYSNYIQRNIFNPLNMCHSSMEDSNVDQSQMSLTYLRHKENEEYGLRSQPAGNLYSNVLDMSCFIRMALNTGEPIMSANSFSQMICDQTAHTRFDSGNKFGLNWVVARPGLEYLGQVIWHNGGTINFMSSLVVLPDCGLGVIVLSNSARSTALVEKTADDILKAAAKCKLDISEADRKVTKLTNNTVDIPAEVAKITEGYYATLVGAIKIRRKGKKLIARLVSTPLHITLNYQSDGWFSLRAKLFGFIPLPIKKLKAFRIQIQQVKDKTIIRAKATEMPFLAGVAYTPQPLTEVWRSLLGKYEVQYPKDDFHWFSKLRLVEKDGFLILAVKFNGIGAMNAPLIQLKELNDAGQHMAIIAGLGRGMRETIYVDHSGAKQVLLYSGYRLVKYR